MAFAFNTTSQATTQISPFEFVFHSSRRRLDSMLVPHEDDEDDADPDYTAHTKTLREQQADLVKRNIKKWEKVYQAVRRRIKNAQKVRAQNQAKMALLFHPYQPGDRVRKKNHSTIQGSSKLSKPIKPDIYVVRRKLGDVNYEILPQDENSTTPEIVHHNQLVKAHRQTLQYEREFESEDDDDDLTDEGIVQSPVCNPLLKKSERQRNPVQILHVQPEKKTYSSRTPTE